MTSVSLLHRILHASRTMGVAEARVAAVVSAQPGEVIRMSMANLAQQAQVSDPTIVRFCRRFGFTGYQDFKLHLAQSLVPTAPFAYEQITADDTVERIVRKTAYNSLNAISRARDDIKPGQNAEAAASPEGLRGFAQENAGLQLGGVAWLQVADTAYEADQFSEAANAYEQSLKGLASGSVLANRAALGLAVSQLKSGAETQGRAGLAALADSSVVSVAVRAEAAYHLALFAHVAGDQEAFSQRATQLAQIDPTSLWNQRLLSLQVTRSMSGAAGAVTASQVTPVSPSVSTLPAALLTPAQSAEESAPTSAAEPSESVIKFNLGN